MEARAGNRGLPPFERVVELHGPALLRFCRVQAGAGHGEDCFQESLLAALRAYPALRDPRAIRSWLFSIALRKALDARRTRAKTPRATIPVEALAAADARAPRDEALWAQVEIGRAHV